MIPLSHIMCVDDEEDILQVTRLSLETVGGYHVTPCKGGAGALEMARRIRPNLILLDVMMPGMDGPSTFRVLQTDPEVAAIPVVFMTAKVQSSEVANYIKLGAVGVVPKPFDPMTLPKQVEALWETFQKKKNDR